MRVLLPANKLAEFIIAKTPERRERVVRQTKAGGSGHPIYYQCFHKPAKTFLVGGATDATGLLAAMEQLKSRKKTPWYEIDSRITAAALKALVQLGPKFYSLHAAFVEPGVSRALLRLPEAEIAVRPNLLVHGERNGKPLVGALRFYLAKESPYQIGVRGAELVAVMQYLWLTQIATGARTPDPELCIVAECMQQRLTRAPRDPAAHIAAIERGAREFARLWHDIDDKEAA